MKLGSAEHAENQSIFVAMLKNLLETLKPKDVSRLKTKKAPISWETFVSDI